MISLIDTHAHLDHIENLDEELKLAQVAGITAIMAMSVSVESCRKNLEIIRTHFQSQIFLALGIHPAEADVSKLDECCELIRQNKDRIKAVGEVGLDFWYKDVRQDEAKKETQKKVFWRLCELSCEMNLPVVVHSRGAQKHCLEILADTGVGKAVFHWYDASIPILKNILDQGYLISATPNLSYNTAAREAVEFAPADRVLIETDSPVRFCNRSIGEEFQAGPKDVRRTLKAYAELKKIDEESAANTLNQNARRFFNVMV
ncbi:MAG: hypothetical protein COW13_03070 [Candidatus Omnitrophica bacterium CG12_big_fil_rev_8_21_14_0_65_50_5]|nr:MAG: hypothetical protein COW13_03070 [Candidatus Omnitrophica bacterium CG12_big_fil_rev_8_21_14_0_65_50_5]